MLISKNCKLMDIENISILELNGYSYYYDGFVYAYGYNSGEESVMFLANEYMKTGIIPFERLHGAFSILIKSPDESAIFFTDNSYMHVLYVHEYGISSSFLKLLDYLLSKDCSFSFNKEALAQKYCVGRTFFNKTLISEILLSDSSEYYYINDGKIEKKKKQISDIDEINNSITPDELFNNISKSLLDMKVSVALTGGYDSRLVYSFMKNRMPVLPTLSGDNESDIDIVISKKVAQKATDKLYLVHTCKPFISEDILHDMFKVFDGSSSFVEESWYRLYKYFEKLSNLGCKIHLTGDGGVLHKDWEWMQDLPFYRKKDTDLEKFYHQRLAFNYDDKYLSSSLKKEANEMKSKILLQLQTYKRSINTQSYDMLYYHVNGRRDVVYNRKIHGITQYAPLLERDIVAYSYRLPRRKRFFYNNIRSLITQQNKKIARVPTNYGMTASNEKFFLLRDVIFQIIDYGKKLIRMIGRKVSGKTLLCGSVSTWEISQDLSKLNCFQEAVNFCKEFDMIDKNVEISKFSKKQIEFILQVYFIAKYAKISS